MASRTRRARTRPCGVSTLDGAARGVLERRRRRVLEHAHAGAHGRVAQAERELARDARARRRPCPTRRRGTAARRPRPASRRAVRSSSTSWPKRRSSSASSSSHASSCGSSATVISPVSSSSQSMPWRSTSATMPSRFSLPEPLEHGHLAGEPAHPVGDAVGERGDDEPAVAPARAEPGGLGLEHDDVARRDRRPWRAAPPTGP